MPNADLISESSETKLAPSSADPPRSDAPCALLVPIYEITNVEHGLTRVFPIQIHAIEAVSLHELNQTGDETGSVGGGGYHVAPSFLGRAGICERPSTNGNSSLQARVLGFNGSKVTKHSSHVCIHACYSKGIRIEIGKGHIEMSKTCKVQITWRNRVTRPFSGPSLVVRLHRI